MDILTKLLLHGPFDFFEVPVCSRLLFGPFPFHDWFLANIVGASITNTVHGSDNYLKEQSETDNSH